MSSVCAAVKDFIGEAFIETLSPHPRHAAKSECRSHPYLTSEMRGVGVLIVSRGSETDCDWKQDQELRRRRVTPLAAVAIASELSARGAEVALVLTRRDIEDHYGSCREVERFVNHQGILGSGRGKGCKCFAKCGFDGPKELAMAVREKVMWVRGQLHVVIFLDYGDTGRERLNRNAMPNEDENIKLVSCLSGQSFATTGPIAKSSRIIVASISSEDTHSLSLKQKFVELYPDVVSVVIHTTVRPNVLTVTVERCCCRRKCIDPAVDAILCMVLADAPSLRYCDHWHYIHGMKNKVHIKEC